jgi:hypothetical protein
MRWRSFTVSETLRIVKEAEEIGNRAAGQKYDIPESCIRDWREKKEILLKSSGTQSAFRGQKVKYQINRRKASWIREWEVAIWVRSFYRNVPVKGLSIGKITGNRWFQDKTQMDYEVFLQETNSV